MSLVTIFLGIMEAEKSGLKSQKFKITGSSHFNENCVKINFFLFIAFAA
jgi:hypothetical protein